jgi:hypothetical protein
MAPFAQALRSQSLEVEGVVLNESFFMVESSLPVTRSRLLSRPWTYRPRGRSSSPSSDPKDNNDVRDNATKTREDKERKEGFVKQKATKTNLSRWTQRKSTEDYLTVTRCLLAQWTSVRTLFGDIENI